MSVESLFVGLNFIITSAVLIILLLNLKMVKGYTKKQEVEQDSGVSIKDVSDSSVSTLDNADIKNIEELERAMIQMIESGKDKLRSSILAFIRMPYSRKIFEITLDRYLKKYDAEPNVNIRLGLISQINSAIDRFEAACDIKDLKHVEDTKKFISEKSEQLLQEIESQDETKLKEKIKKLSNYIDKLHSKPNIGDDDYQRIKELDEDIDKNEIKRFSRISGLYFEQIKKMQEVIKDKEQVQSKDFDRKIIEYNQKALEGFKQAIDNYHNDKSTFNKGERLDQVVNWMGGYNSSYLRSEVSMFFGYVYGEIFSGLKKPSSKIWLTEEMLKAQDREL